jgi:hypothetical protein
MYRRRKDVQKIRNLKRSHTEQDASSFTPWLVHHFAIHSSLFFRRPSENVGKRSFHIAKQNNRILLKLKNL